MGGAAQPRLGRANRWRVVISTLVVMGGVLLSRILGLVRDAAILYRFAPPNSDLDAYLAAFRVPDFLYAVVIGGALATTLIPVFQQVWLEEGETRAWQVASAVLNLAVVTLVLLMALVALAAGPVVAFLFPVSSLEQQRLIVGLTRLFLLSPLLLGIGGVAMGLLNARERFGVPALAFNVYNLLIILGAIFLAPIYGIWGVAYGLIAGAALYLTVQLPALRAAGMRYSPRLGLRDAAVRRVGRLIVPRLVGQSAVHLNFIALTSFAALLPDNQIAPLNQAYQLMLLPHGVFVMSLVTVLFPRMSQLWAAGDLAPFRETALRAVRLVVFVTVPVATALAVLRVPAVRLLYERGQFDATSTALIAAPLLVYLSSSVAFAASEPLIRTFYAMQDTRTPVLVAVATVTLNIVLGYAVVHGTTWGAPGLALAFSVANNLEALALLLLLLPRLGGLRASQLPRSLVVAASSAALMGFALWTLLQVSRPLVPMVALEGRYGAGADALRLLAWLALAGVVAVAVYLLSAALLRAPELAEARGLLRRRRGAE
ncbi:MAG TPA: murein biosynthesis integral membrane protein MurJ [Herpetosiphonaceae bacterium]|nr:murein biosynthesis integral membrane protein MurJ [Herpetosiphonaceae bacterium]